jgi:hypothetical protein
VTGVDAPECRVFARVYRTAAEARQAYQQALEEYIATAPVEVGFFLCWIPDSGHVVVAVGRDASPGMLAGGEPADLPQDLRGLFAGSHRGARPSPHGRWVVRRSHVPGAVLSMP